MYVDNMVSGGETEEEVLDLCIRSKEIFRKGRFNLRNFMASSNHLQTQLDQMQHQESTTPLQHDEPSYSESTLGTVHSPSSNTEH